MKLTIILLPFLWAALIIYAVVGRLLGLFVCAYGVFDTLTIGSPIDGITEKWAMHRYMNRWIDSWWGNASDGLLGDQRGEWYAIVKGRIFSRWSMYRWSALRNGFHNGLLKSWAACDVRSIINLQYWGSRDVVDKPGGEGWQFVIAKTEDRTYYGLNIWIKYPWTKERGFMVKMGHKVKPKHMDYSSFNPPLHKIYTRESKNFKTFSFYVNPLQTGHHYDD